MMNETYEESPFLEGVFLILPARCSNGISHVNNTAVLCVLKKMTIM